MARDEGTILELAKQIGVSSDDFKQAVNLFERFNGLFNFFK